MSLKIINRSLPNVGRGYSPPGDGPFPAVLILHGSNGKWSGWDHRTAAIFAVHGFLAIPFGYSNGGNAWNAGDIIDVPLDRTADALAALRAHELAGRKIGLYGISRGAEHALLLTSLMARDSGSLTPSLHILRRTSFAEPSRASGGEMPETRVGSRGIRESGRGPGAAPPKT
jgi:pimeloyl-ACP methyl ester carboxylesterase